MNKTSGAPQEGGEDRDLTRDTSMGEGAGAPVALRRNWNMMLHHVDCPRLHYLMHCDCDGPETLGNLYIYLKIFLEDGRVYNRKSVLEALKKVHR